MPKHECKNEFRKDGANGACYFEITDTEKEGIAFLDVGWSCVIVHRKEIPISHLAEIIAIATAHKDGIAGFLRETKYGGDSYALMCDPP